MITSWPSLTICEDNPPDNSPTKSSYAELWCSCDVSLSKPLINQTRCLWFETQWRSYDITVMNIEGTLLFEMMLRVFHAILIPYAPHYYSIGVYIVYVALYLLLIPMGFGIPISLSMIVRSFVLHLIVIIKSYIWIMSYCLVLAHETMVCAVGIAMFYFRIIVPAIAIKYTCIHVRRIHVKQLLPRLLILLLMSKCR